MDKLDDVLHILCLHRELENDLHFRESLTRSLVSASGRYLLCVGSGERAANISGHGEKAAQFPETELTLESEVTRNLFEIEFRAAGKQLIHNFTDAGISCVGVVGADRGILKRDDAGILFVKGIGSLIALTRSGVVSVLFTSGTDTGGNVVDLNPLDVSVAVKKTIEETEENTKGQILLLISTVSKSLTEKMDSASVVECESRLDFPDGLPAVIRALTVPVPGDIRILTAARLGISRGARLSL